MANRVTPIPSIDVLEKNRFHLRRDFRFLKSEKLFTKRKLKRMKNVTKLYDQVELMIVVSRFFCLWPLRKDFRLCTPFFLLCAAAISVWAFYSLSYARKNFDLLFVATARYILTTVRLMFCCLSVISSLYLYVCRRSTLSSFFQGMAKVDSVLRSLDCSVLYPMNASFFFHSFLMFFLIYFQTNFFSRLSFLLEVQNQYRYCVFVVIHMFFVLLNGVALRFQILSSLVKKCDYNSRYRLYTLVSVHKNLCHHIRKLREIYSFQIVVILAVIIITFIWNIHRFAGILFSFEDEFAKQKTVSIKNRTIMITIYTYWLWLVANAGENIKKSGDNFYEELYTVMVNDETHILSSDLALKGYLTVRPSADYKLCKIMNLDNKIIQSVMGITVSYVIISIQLSVPCKCSNGSTSNHFL